jgi:hypothetical protein
MDRQKINRISGIVPVVMSLLAFAVVLVVVTTGWERHLKDEGIAAHIFQLLIVGQVPFILTFLATANWHQWRRLTGPIALQLVAIVVAFAPVAFFKL